VLDCPDQPREGTMAVTRIHLHDRRGDTANTILEGTRNENHFQQNILAVDLVEGDNVQSHTNRNGQVENNVQHSNFQGENFHTHEMSNPGTTFVQDSVLL
jgi:hypothetical protein